MLTKVCFPITPQCLLIRKIAQTERGDMLPIRDNKVALIECGLIELPGSQGERERGRATEHLLLERRK